MFYEKITQQELNFMTRPDGITPNYTFEDYIVNYDVETGEAIEEYYVNLTVHKTADEVYQESLNPAPPQENKMEVLEARVDGLENINAGLLLENANQQVKINEQEMTNAQMLLEIAMLKGAML